VHGFIDGFTPCGVPFKAIRAFGVLPENLEAHLIGTYPFERYVGIQEGFAWSIIHVELKALPEPKQQLLCVASIWDPRVPHCAEQDGVKRIPECPEVLVRQGFAGGEVVVSPIGVDLPFESTAAISSPIQDRIYPHHDLGTDAVSWNDGYPDHMCVLDSACR
jgi:hypothetical protein